MLVTNPAHGGLITKGFLHKTWLHTVWTLAFYSERESSVGIKDASGYAVTQLRLGYNLLMQELIFKSNFCY